MKKTLNKKRFIQFSALILAILFLLVSIKFFSVLTLKSFAYNSDYEASGEYTNSLSIDNSSFSNGTSFSTPSGWTENGVKNDKQKAGILSIANDNSSESRLDKFMDEKLKAHSTDSDGSVLLINSNFSDTTSKDNQELAYGFTSPSVSLNQSSFYEISVFAKTSNFATQGATIRVNGLGEDVAFENVDSNMIENTTNGWAEYKIYIATAPYSSKDATVSLLLGDIKLAEDSKTSAKIPTYGYALFDDITVKEISATLYNNIAYSDYSSSVEVFDLQDKDATKKFTLQSGNHNYIAGSNITAGNYNPNSAFSKTNTWGLTNEPNSAIGKIDDSALIDNDIIIISNYDSTTNTFKKDTASAIEFKNAIVIEPLQTYKLSTWVKTEDKDGNASASIGAIRLRTDYPENIYANNTDTEDTFLNFSASSLTGTASNKARHGWTEQVFYIKGSSTRTVNAYLSLWLGFDKTPVTGVAMYSNINLYKISSKDYNSYSSTGTVVSFDLEDTSNITNGFFTDYATDYDEDAFPISPANWNQKFAHQTSTTGKSNDNVKTDDVVGGIILTQPSYFNANIGNDANNALIKNPSTFTNYVTNINRTSTDKLSPSTALVLSSKNKTAVNFTSADITATASASMRIDVSIATTDISGHGANLVLKSGSKAISTIENIVSDKEFKTYSFYIENGTEENTLTLEIWLGLNDSSQNVTKLSSGTVYINYVDSVTLNETSTDSDGNETTSEYDMTPQFTELNQQVSRYFDTKNYSAINMGVYSFKSNNDIAYDYYSTSYIKPALNWTNTITNATSTSSSGYISYENILSSNEFANLTILDKNGSIPTTFPTSIYVIKNSQPNAIKSSLNIPYSLTSGTYYKFTVTMRVDLNEDNSDGGATISINDGLSSFENIKTTLRTVDNNSKNVFKDYTFYISASDDISAINLAISLGTKEKTAQGYVYLLNTSLETLEETDYTKTVKKINANNDNREKSNYDLELATTTRIAGSVPIDNSVDTPSVTPDTNNEFSWLMFPAIFASVALVLALIIVLGKKGYDRAHSGVKKVKKAQTSNYDRTNARKDYKSFTTTTVGEDGKTTTTTTTPPASADDLFAKFDEDNDTTQETVIKKVPSQVEIEATENVTENFAEFDENDEDLTVTADNASAEDSIAIEDTSIVEERLNADVIETEENSVTADTLENYQNTDSDVNTVKENNSQDDVKQLKVIEAKKTIEKPKAVKKQINISDEFED